VRVAVPVRPVELRTSGNTAVPPGSTVAVVEPFVAGVMARPTPVPVSVTDCGLPVALSRMLSDPLRGPIVVGVNVTLISQLEFGVSATVVEHAGLALAAVVTAKLPEGVNAVNVTLAFPVFVTVTCCAALVVFAFCAAKVSELVESETCRIGATPVPLSG